MKFKAPRISKQFIRKAISIIFVAQSAWLLVGCNRFFVKSLSASVETEEKYAGLLRPLDKVALGVAVGSGIESEAALRNWGLNLDKARHDPNFRAENTGRWGAYLETAQILTLMREYPYFFGVGFELESANRNAPSSTRFGPGSAQILKMVQDVFGSRSPAQIQESGKLRGDLTDRGGKVWTVVPEFVDDDNSVVKTGWETITPPFLHPDSMRLLASFLWKFTQSDFGQTADLAGNHQTFDLLPYGTEPSESSLRLAALTGVNAVLLIEQHAPSIFEILKINRSGGVRNIFIRPWALDHADLLEELSRAKPEKITPQWIQSLQQEKYLAVERRAQTGSHQFLWDQGVFQRRADFEEEINGSLWKHRSAKFRWMENKPPLLEIRLPDYTRDPNSMLRSTLLFQALLNTAYNLALQNKVFSWRRPVGLDSNSSVSLEAAWSKLKAQTSVNALLQDLEIREPTLIAVLLGQAYSERSEKFKAGPATSFGFEIESSSLKGIAQFLRPLNADKLQRWDGCPDSPCKDKILVESGVQPDSFTVSSSRVFGSEFMVDVELHPFLHGESHMEESGNLEIKSSGKGLTDERKTIDVLNRTVEKFPHTVFPQIHMVFPSKNLSKISNIGTAQRFANFVDLFSTYLMAEDYLSIQSNPQPPHDIDAWSVDRFSRQELEKLAQHLQGKITLSNTEEKHHYLGVRPVQGGLDLEIRFLPNPEKSLLLMRMITAAIQGDLLQQSSFSSPSGFFHDFTQTTSELEGQFLRLDHALKDRLTKEQLNTVRKLQFEVYRPSMNEFMVWPGFEPWNTVSPDLMDIKYARANYESNIAVSLQPWERLVGFRSDAMQNVLLAREQYLTKIVDLAKKIHSQESLKFVTVNENFLHLAGYLKRSQHPSRPDLKDVDSKESQRQREALEALTFEMRRLAVQFLRDSRVSRSLEDILNPRS
jgi:hypothetical protein